MILPLIRNIPTFNYATDLAHLHLSNLNDIAWIATYIIILSHKPP